jgi:hypothetical protein
MRPLGVLLVLVAVGGWPGSAAQACSCAHPGPPCRALSNSDAVFAGRVSEIRDEDGPPRDGGVRGPRRRVRLVVEESFRGAGVKRGGALEVATGLGGGDCGYRFEVGERYLVYAEHPTGGDGLYTGICSRTRPLADAGVDLDYLRARTRPERAAGIEGSIDELARDPVTRDTRLVGPMRGVTVVAERLGDRRRWEARTDEHGWFRIWGLTFGRYTVRAVLPETFAPEATTRDGVDVESGVCGWVHMLATPRP